MLSYNDCSITREWYADFRVLEVQWQYTLGQGETRIGKNRVESGTRHVKQSHELLIVKERSVPKRSFLYTGKEISIPTINTTSPDAPTVRLQMEA